MTIPVIGVIGGIGSGKSTVAAEFASHGGVLISGDRLGHEALEQPALKAAIVARWGDGVLNADGQIDRPKLGGLIFADAAEQKALEAITHPYIKQRMREEIKKAREEAKARLIVLDAAVMLEAGWHDVCNSLVFIDSPRETRLQRLHQGRGWSARDVELREAAQMPLEEKRRRADSVVDNSTGPEAIAPKVRFLLERWGLL
jgi:dephospho-CoA kinase